MRRFATAAAIAIGLLRPLGAMDVRDLVEPGEPLVGALDGDEERSLLLAPVELRERDGGKLIASSRLFRIGRLQYGFVLGVPSGTPPGQYVVRSAGQQAPVTVAVRKFPTERIPLNVALSDLMTREDPAKNAENAALERVLARFDPEAVLSTGPFRLPVEHFRRTAAFGQVREYVLSDGTTTVGVHRGVDMALPEGSPVVAPAAGLVVMARHRIMTGNTVILEHLPGMYSLYFHLSRLDVTEGDRVEGGAELGLVGATGLATGPHLHWEVRVGGVAVDPESLTDPSQVDMSPLLPDIIEHRQTKEEGR